MARQKDKVVIIGAGMVGSAVLEAIVGQSLVSEVVVIDQNMDKALGEVMDASHTTAFAYATNTYIHGGDYSECADAKIIVMTAGPSISQNEADRSLLAVKNAAVVKDVMKNVMKYTTDAIIIAVTNPLDLVVYAMARTCGYPAEKVIGTGTLLDTARFRQLLGSACGVDSKNVHGYVLGEHGATSVIPWKLVQIAGIPLDSLDTYFDVNTPLTHEDLLEKTRNAGLEVLRKKGYTNFGIAHSVCRIVKAIVLNEHCLLPVSVAFDEMYGIRDMAMSLVCKVGEAGVEKLVQLPLDEQAVAELKISSEAIRHNLKVTGLQ